MTPTTSTSSITLLNPAAPSVAKTAPAAGDEAAPNATLSGFELLLGAVQQLQQTLPADGGKANMQSKGTENTENKDDESGNALPQLGTILPSLSLPQTAKIEDSDQTKTKSDTDADKKNSDDQTPQANAIAIIPNFAPTAPALPNAANAAGAAGVSASSAVDTAALAQIDNVSDSKGDGSSAKASRETNSAALAQALTGSDGKESNTLLDTTKAVTASSLQNSTESAKPASESDFDALIKHFEAPAATQTSSVVNTNDTSNVNQMSRTYSNAANNTTTVQVPVGNSGWSDAVADKVMWFSANKVSSAEIHLNPPDLGPLQVRISTQHDQASVVFTSQHAAVRDALDQALPRLREMMGSQGMHLLDASVGGQSQQQSQQQFSRNDSANRDSSSFSGFFGDEPTDTKTANVASINTARLLRSGVDAYA